MRFEGKNAIVTGAGGYIGGEVALSLAREGAKVLLCDINSEALEKTQKRIEDIGAESRICILDVTNSAQVDSVVQNFAVAEGGLDIMIHVAGGSARIAGGKYVYLADQTDEVIDGVLKVNLYGAIYMSRAAARIMREQGRGGRIINFSSTVGINGLKCCTEYAASKGGVISLTKSLSKEMGEYKVTVNSVAPGIVKRPEENRIGAENTNFLGELCTAEDIAGTVCYLCSDEARFITGQIYVVDGGRSLGMKGSD